MRQHLGADLGQFSKPDQTTLSVKTIEFGLRDPRQTSAEGMSFTHAQCIKKESKFSFVQSKRVGTSGTEGSALEETPKPKLLQTERVATKLCRLKPALEHSLQPQLQRGPQDSVSSAYYSTNTANSIQIQLMENELLKLVDQKTSVSSPRCAPEPPPT